MTLAIGSIQYASADHSLGGNGIFMDENNVNLATTKDSKFLIHLQIIVRDGQGQLVSVTESTHGSYIPHRVTDQIFDNIMGEKEIYIIDDVKYEKVRYTVIHDVQTFDWDTSFQDVLSVWSIKYCADLTTTQPVPVWTTPSGNIEHCIPIFHTIASNTILAEDDVFTLHWTILREF